MGNDAPNALAHFQRARQELALASSVDEVKQIRDKAEAVRLYAKQSGESLLMQNQAAEIKIRAERRAGELLKEMELSGGSLLRGSTMEPRGNAAKLSDLGITKQSSHRWQMIAELPESEFESVVSDAIESNKELTSSAVLSVAKKHRKSSRVAEDIQQTESPCSVEDLFDCETRFSTIYADPPWRYGNQGTRAATDNHYPTMSVEEICELPVANIAAERALLFLWTTNGFIEQALTDVIPAWGFEYKSMLIWCKEQMGLGNYVRVSHEILLIASRGGMTGVAKDIKSWVVAPRSRHSSKPQVFRDIVERISHDGPRIELFAREARPGWFVWGNQIDRQQFLGASA